MKNKIIIVSGLPRSGTSLMMQILQAAGIPLLTDDSRPADEDNPKGYFEFEPVKRLEKESAWLAQAKGKAVKVVSHLLKYLPSDFNYIVLFMNRDLDEIIASQNKMLLNSHKSLGKLTHNQLREKYALHLNQIHHWLALQPNILFEDIHFNALIRNPKNELTKVWCTLKPEVSMEAVLSVIQPDLYRSKK
jgi:hypothetical protein